MDLRVEDEQKSLPDLFADILNRGKGLERVASRNIKICSVSVNLFKRKCPEGINSKPKRERIIPIDPVESAEIRKSRGSRGVFQMGTYLIDFRRIPV